MRDRTSQGDGPGWAARVLETPCLFWELFRTLRFWKAMAALYNCYSFGEEAGTARVQGRFQLHGKSKERARKGKRGRGGERGEGRERGEGEQV